MLLVLAVVLVLVVDEERRWRGGRAKKAGTAGALFESAVAVLPDEEVDGDKGREATRLGSALESGRSHAPRRPGARAASVAGESSGRAEPGCDWP